MCEYFAKRTSVNAACWCFGDGGPIYKIGADWVSLGPQWETSWQKGMLQWEWLKFQ